MLFAKRAQELGLEVSNPVDTHKISNEISKKVNALENADPTKMEVLRAEVKSYFSELKKKKLRDWILNPFDHRRIGFFSALMYILFFISSFPFFVFGVITNYIPYKVPWMITKRVVKEVEWSSSINGTIGVYFWQIYWLLQSLAVALIFRNWYLLCAFMILVPVTGILAQAYWTYLKRFFGSMRWWMMSADAKKKLVKSRADILKVYDPMS